MFCNKCGNQLPDDAGFCNKCGTKLGAKGTVHKNSDSSKQDQYRGYAGSAATDGGYSQKEKANVLPKFMETISEAYAKIVGKVKQRPLIFGAVASAILIIVLVISLSGNNYIEQVRKLRPFEESSGLPYSCETVFARYIESPKYTYRKSDGIAFVDIKGKAKGTNSELTIIFQVAPDPDGSNNARITPQSATLGDIKYSSPNEAVGFLSNVFIAYDRGEADLSDLETRIKNSQRRSNPLGVAGLIISLVAAFIIVNAAQRLFMGAMGASIMFFSMKKKLIAIVVVTIIIYGLIGRLF